MKKRTGIITIIVMLLVTGLLYYTTGIGWGPTGTGAAKNITTGLDLAGGVSITYQADQDNPSASDMSDTITKLQQRVQNYSTEAQVYQEGTNRINVEIPGVSDADAILEELGTPGSLYFISQTDSEGNENYTYNSYLGYTLNKTIDELKEDGSIVCEGSDVADAQGVARTNSSTNATEYVVQLTFTTEGAEKFATATQKAYENSESIAIYYDNKFVSVPKVNAAITDGNAVVEGMSTIEEAQNLASYIRIGGLTLTLNEIRSNVVGAQLGEQALQSSLIGGVIGLAIVCVIMIVFYLLPGVIATLALLVYAALMLILLNAFDLTLTLPGIAGIVLSIGMAVDANVIIYARIKEEIAAGVSVQGAIRTGFKKAMSAIIDGNVTTLIAAATLGVLGSGTIKGFAMTLALGVVLSLFTACFVSKLLANAFFAIGFKDTKFWARKGKSGNFNFVKHKMKFGGIALAIIIVGFIFMGVNAAQGNHTLNFSLDFLGGTATTVDFNEDMSLEELDEKVKPLVEEVTGDAAVSMQKVVNSNEVIIKTRTLDMDEREALSTSLTENFDIESTAITAESISATVGTEMRKSAILAIVIAVLLMLLYIFIRFRDIRFASAAIIALIHDVLIVLTSYAVLRISVGNSFIAVMLTILGYSINSTIVIFDRIREKLPTIKKGGNLTALVNEAINATLTRSILTNLTTFASILVLYIIGVSSIKEFTLPMLVGIIAGAFSSVCLTGSLWFVLRTRVGKNKDYYSTEDVPVIAASAAVGAEENTTADVKEGVVKNAAKNDTIAVRSERNPNVIRKKKKK